MIHTRIWHRSLTMLLLLLLLGSSVRPASATPVARIKTESLAASGIEFTHNGGGYTLTYRFTPNTGTLNDLRVRYNNSFEFYPAYWGGIYEVMLAGETLRPWDARVAKQFLSESNSNGVYTANFRWSYNGDALDFSVRLWPEQNKLRIVYDAASEKITQFHLDRSEQTPDPKVVELPYGHNVLYSNGIFVSGMIDHQASNASLLYPLKAYFSNTSAYFGYGGNYTSLTNNRRRPLHEEVTLAVSPTIEEVFHYPNNPVSPYKNYLADKVIVDLWQGDFAQQRQTLQTLADRGLTDLFVLLHRWQRFGYDDALPTTYPAGNAFGGPGALRPVIDLCTAKNYSFALHTNYTEAYDNSPDWNPGDLILDANGNHVHGWFNSGTQRWSFVTKSASALQYANKYEPLIHNDYRTSAAFLDVHTAVLPGYRTDQDAAIADPGRQAVVLRDYRNLVADARELHGGPVAGEGFGYTTHLWAGYVDGIEADPRAFHDTTGGTEVPTLVDYKLRALHQLFVPHGVGYLERFYLDQWADFTPAQLERYRATELAFGNAGFLSDLFGRNFTSERAITEAVREYCVMKSLQKRYLPTTPSTIRYNHNNQWQPLSDALRAVLPTTTFEQVDATLSEALGVVQVVYANGFTLYVNRTANRNQDVTLNGTRYTLPPNGFLAHQGSDFLAYNAIANGVQSHYICPSEGLCSTCPTPTPTLKNGDFELGANGDWRISTRRGQPIITTSAGVTPRSGRYVAQLGVVNSETSTLAQSVQLPSSSPISLRYYYQSRSEESRCTTERAEVRINGKRLATHALCTAQATSQWLPATLDLSRYAGQRIEIQFYLKTNSSRLSSFFVDDVTLANTVGVQVAAAAAELEAIMPELSCSDEISCAQEEENATMTTATPAHILYLPVITKQQ